MFLVYVFLPISGLIVAGIRSDSTWYLGEFLWKSGRILGVFWKISLDSVRIFLNTAGFSTDFFENVAVFWADHGRIFLKICAYVEKSRRIFEISVRFWADYWKAGQSLKNPAEFRADFFEDRPRFWADFSLQNH